jgi:hypothetical protein
MMKKLVVTVFALSLTALGCGSDDGGKKDAAPKLDGPVGVEVQTQPDVPVVNPDVPVSGPEVQADQAIAVDQTQAVEVQPTVEVQPSEAGAVDQGQAIDVQPTMDGGTPDAPEGIDGSTADTAQPTEAGMGIDGGMDSGSVG